jgi:GNAT superfamily N-acetyltransferase
VAPPAGYTLADELPSVAEYCELRRESGLTEHAPESVGLALPNTWAAVVARDRAGVAVGMGRVIGDGGCFFQVVDMAVLPEHQRRGLGDAILSRLLERLRADAPPDAWISLFADPPGRALYARHGFEPTDPAQVGMGLSLRDATA